MATPTGLLTFFHPSDKNAEQTILETYTSALPDFRSPRSTCTSSSHWTPATRKKALPYGKLTASFPESLSDRPVLGGLDVFIDVEKGRELRKEVQSRVQGAVSFAAPADTATWHLAGGFLSRHSREAGRRNDKGEKIMVITAFFNVKEDEGSMEGFVEAMSAAANSVKATEPGTLTYAFFTNDNNEILVFERYREVADFQYHCSTDAFKKNGKATGKFLELTKTRFAEWEEIEECFVGNEVASGEEGGAKL